MAASDLLPIAFALTTPNSGEAVQRGTNQEHALAEPGRHRSADHGLRNGHPLVVADPGNAGGLLPLQRVQVRDDGRDRARPHRRAVVVRSLQDQLLDGARSQPVTLH